ncbi:MAG: hypothetical protein Harvfovirus21_20 [Harvfovirus sp.]|uniref:Uncharacterized protein n=1 Tax=Harvfovirus sp. TaxID=2487768 RepID=A0A3G5A5X6_9VIRU|nr:MAG: hypothetical protein Harvfovirus21_20 [Harvfovirus sp.]
MANKSEPFAFLSDGERKLRYEILPHGAVAFRFALSSKEQQKLLSDIRSKLTLHRDMTCVKLGDVPSPLLGLELFTGWRVSPDADRPSKSLKTDASASATTTVTESKLPVCLEVAGRIYNTWRQDASQQSFINDHNTKTTNAQLKYPDVFVAYNIWARCYQFHEALGFHQDPLACSGTVLINCGCAVNFAFSRGKPKGEVATITYITETDLPKEEDGKVHTLRLESGDAIYFNGSVLFHAITKIHKDSLPDWWTEKSFVRIGIQMRAYWAGNT